jgi:DNA helicase IV
VQSVFKVSVKVCSSTPALVSNLKRHPALYDRIWARGDQIKKSVPTRFQLIRREIAEWMTDRKFLNEIVDGAGGSLSRNAVEETVRHTMLQLAQTDERQYQGYDPQSLKTIDGRAMSEGTPQEYAGTVDSEDLPLFLFLKSLRDGEVGRGLAHLVVDEAEDVSLFELDILGKALGKDRSVTLSGDDAQQTYSSFCGWQFSLKAMNASEAAVCRLQTTYRCPKPIAWLAQEVLGSLAPQMPAVSGREGVPIGRFRFSEEAHATLFLVDAIRDLVEREPQASVGVITRSIETAKAFYKLTEDIQEVRMVMNGEFSFQPGVDVTDVASVKGLEFDYVIVPDASCKVYPEDDDSRRAMHVVVTRASHQLWLISVGTPSPLLGTFSSFSDVEADPRRINE